MPKQASTQVFFGDNRIWSDYIFLHRMTKVKGADPSGRGHADLIVGPMADNDTGKIVTEAVFLNKDEEWFYDQITRTERGRRLDGLQLGNQIVFSTERFESSLRLVGYYIYVGGRWNYDENANTIESL